MGRGLRLAPKRNHGSPTTTTTNSPASTKAFFFYRKDVLNELNDAELVKRYRLDRAAIIFVTDLVWETLTRPTARNKALSPEMKVILTLRYLATGKMTQFLKEAAHSEFRIASITSLIN